MAPYRAVLMGYGAMYVHDGPTIEKVSYGTTCVAKWLLVPGVIYPMIQKPAWPGSHSP